MARPTLDRNPKYRMLISALAIPRPQVRGLLEMIWDSANETGNPVFSCPEAVEAVAEWWGEPGALAAALTNPKHNFLDLRDDGKLEIHDYFDHAPEYVKGRWRKEKQRRQSREETATDSGQSRDSHGTDPKKSDTHAHAPAHIELSGDNSRAETPEDPALDAADDPVVLTFRCDGKPKSWQLRESKVREYENTYATINVREKLLHLWQWVEDNPAKRKTAGGMKAFLSRNLSREVDQKRDRGPYNGNSNGHAVEVDPELLASIRGGQ